MGFTFAPRGLAGALAGAAWAQEMERFSDQANSDYYEVMKFMEGIDYLPPVIFKPGFIGGHCVMPNIQILSSFRESTFLDLIKDSNMTKAEQCKRMGIDINERLIPLDHVPNNSINQS